MATLSKVLIRTNQIKQTCSFHGPTVKGASRLPPLPWYGVGEFWWAQPHPIQPRCTPPERPVRWVQPQPCLTLTLHHSIYHCLQFNVVTLPRDSLSIHFTLSNCYFILTLQKCTQVGVSVAQTLPVNQPHHRWTSLERLLFFYDSSLILTVPQTH